MVFFRRRIKSGLIDAIGRAIVVQTGNGLTGSEGRLVFRMAGIAFWEYPPEDDEETGCVLLMRRLCLETTKKPEGFPSSGDFVLENLSAGHRLKPCN